MKNFNQNKLDINDYPDKIEEFHNSITIDAVNDDATTLFHFLLGHNIVQFKESIEDKQMAYQKFISLNEYNAALVTLIDKYNSKIKNARSDIARYKQTINELPNLKLKELNNQSPQRHYLDLVTYQELILMLEQKIQNLHDLIDHCSEELKINKNQIDDFLLGVQMNDQIPVVHLREHHCLTNTSNYCTLKLLDLLNNNNIKILTQNDETNQISNNKKIKSHSEQQKISNPQPEISSSQPEIPSSQPEIPNPQEKKSSQHQQKYENKVPSNKANKELPSHHQQQKIIGLFAAAGLLLGAGIGAGLCATGVLAPFGVGILGIVAFAATTGAGLALMSGAFGFATTKFTSQSEVINDTVLPHESYRGISHSLNTSSKIVKRPEQTTDQKYCEVKTEEDRSLNPSSSTNLLEVNLEEKTQQAQVDEHVHCII
ncbi:hypothetical protein [Legionella longbeachae]|uniref:hypothetical protein n=1 Tax=Legionella longbeachae TaxID=450 RepID=UPI001CDA4838|nr:hypothetical protein [Legionella longbeachae]